MRYLSTDFDKSVRRASDKYSLSFICEYTLFTRTILISFNSYTSYNVVEEKKMLSAISQNLRETVIIPYFCHKNWSNFSFSGSCQISSASEPSHTPAPSKLPCHLQSPCFLEEENTSRLKKPGVAVAQSASDKDKSSHNIPGNTFARSHHSNKKHH